VELVLQALIDTEATEVIGADRHERADGRTNRRNGTRERLLATKAGDVELKIPKLRRGASSRRSSSGTAGSIERCWRW
jgi:putative transposase